MVVVGGGLLIIGKRGMLWVGDEVGKWGDGCVSEWVMREVWVCWFVCIDMCIHLYPSAILIGCIHRLYSSAVSIDTINAINAGKCRHPNPSRHISHLLPHISSHTSSHPHTHSHISLTLYITSTYSSSISKSIA
jgi:hypothetical protein